MGESDLVRACLKLLELRGILAWRNNTGGFKDVTGRLVRFGKVGSGDILAVLPTSGRFLSIECKVGSNKPTAPQRAWAADINENGGLAVVVYTLDELDEVLTGAV